MRRLTHFFTIIALVGSLFGSIVVHASATPHCHSEQHELVIDTHKDISAQGECHQTRGFVHCCSSLLFIKGESTFSSITPKIPLVFLESSQAIKPSPLLEGPFQPPRI